MNNYINQSVHNDKVEQLSKQLQQEKLLKQQIFSPIFGQTFSDCICVQAVNKLAEIMNRRDMNLSGKKSKGSSTDLRRKEKIHTQQTLNFYYLLFNFVCGFKIKFIYLF